jgi:hypothetical protein
MKGFFSSGTEQSMTRLCFFSIVMLLLVWETYAVFNKSTVPHIEAILAFAGIMLGNKQIQERIAKKDVINAPAIPAVL